MNTPNIIKETNIKNILQRRGFLAAFSLAVASLAAPAAAQTDSFPIANKPVTMILPAIGSSYVAKAPPDGHTILLGFSHLVQSYAFNRDALPGMKADVEYWKRVVQITGIKAAD